MSRRGRGRKPFYERALPGIFLFMALVLILSLLAGTCQPGVPVAPS